MNSLSPLSDNEIENIVNRVMRDITTEYKPVGRTPMNGLPLPAEEPSPAYLRELGTEPGNGLFHTLDEAVGAARAAFRELQELPLSMRNRMVDAMRHTGVDHAVILAQLARAETGMGRSEDKITKNWMNSMLTPGPEYLTTEAFSGDGGLTITEYAPFGVIGSIIPSTNPTSTVINNSISMISAGNAVVFNAHPGAKQASNYTIQLLNQAIVSVGGPANLLCAVLDPTIETAQALMRHPNIRLLVVTGGPGVVQEAMKAGKRAICAGPGNPPAVVDETADIEQAGRDIVRGGSFDNNIICTTEKGTFAVDRITSDLIEAMVAYGGYVLTSWQARRLWGIVCREDHGPGQAAYMHKEFIGQNASVLLREIGIKVGPEVRQIVVEVEPDHPLVWTEQMMPLMPVVRMPDVHSAIDLAWRSEHGYRHTAVIHSKNVDHMTKMARLMDCSIFVKNGPNFSGLGVEGEGYCSYTIASPTGEGLTTCRSFSRLRRCALIDGFRIT
jgi:aldehyde dehydrogenase